jgi:hypothetical protein
MTKLVAADALPALLGNLVVGNLVTRDFEPVVANHGDIVLLAGHKKQIVLNTHAEATFQIPDVTKVLAVPDLLRLYMEPTVIAIAEKIETDLLGLYAQFSANPVVGTAGTAITEAAVDQAETVLFNAKVPASSQKYLVVDGSTYSQLRQIPRFSEYGSAGEAGVHAMIDGNVGKLKDFFVFRSQFVSKTGSGPVTTNNVGFAKDAIGLAMRRLPQPLPGTGAVAEYAELGNFGMRVVMSYQPNTLAQQFTVDVLYGVGVLRQERGLQVRT